MSFNDYAQEATASGDIGVGFLIDGEGNRYWEHGTENWPALDPMVVLQSWKSEGMGGVTIDNLKFTLIRKEESRFVSTNIGGQGHLIGAPCSNWEGGYVIAWCPNTIGPDVAYTVVQRLANLVTS